VAAAVLGGLVLVLIAAVAPLSMLAGQPVLTQLLQSYPDVVPLAAVGLIVAWRRPANPIGWLILVTAVLFLVKIDAPLYNMSVYRLGHHLPLGPVFLVLDQSWLPALALLPLVILLFPDGRPPGRWRWVRAAYVALVVAYTSLLTANASVAIARGHIQVDSSGQLTIFDHSSAYGGTTVALAVVVAFLGFSQARIQHRP